MNLQQPLQAIVKQKKYAYFKPNNAIVYKSDIAKKLGVGFTEVNNSNFPKGTQCKLKNTVKQNNGFPIYELMEILNK